MRPACIQILFPHGTGAVERLGTNIGKKKKSSPMDTNHSYVRNCFQYLILNLFPHFNFLSIDIWSLERADSGKIISTLKKFLNILENLMLDESWDFHLWGQISSERSKRRMGCFLWSEEIPFCFYLCLCSSNWSSSIRVIIMVAFCVINFAKGS